MCYLKGCENNTITKPENDALLNFIIATCQATNLPTETDI